MTIRKFFSLVVVLSLLQSGALAAAQPALESSAAAALQSSSSALHFQTSSEASRTVGGEVLRQNKLPGLAVTILRDGEEVFSQGFGLADVELKVPATPETLFRIGSLSKLVTVAALARLKEQSKLDWDDSPGDHLELPGDSPLAGSGLTLRRLASHTSGVRHYVAGDPQGCGSFINPQGGLRLQGWDDLRVAVELFDQDPLVQAPGEGYHYSTFAYTLLGALLEEVSGRTFEQLIRDEVFDPLGMEGSTTDRNIPLIENRAEFYILHPQTGEPGNAPCNDSSYKWPGGGLLSSSSEFARFAAAHLSPAAATQAQATAGGEGGPQSGSSGYLQPETLKEIFTAQPQASDRDYQVGLGWRISQDDQGRTLYHHGGAIVGGRAFVLAYPDEKLVVVMLSNAFARFGRTEAQRLAQPFLDR